MTLQQWYDATEGKYLDVDSAFGAQCVDVIKDYYRKVIDIEPQRGNAIDYWTTYPTAHFTRIVNTPSLIPRGGDIVIWGSTGSPGWDGKNVGQYGHIAVCLNGATVNTFKSLDQNWPFSNGTTPAKTITHSYTAIKGILRPKKDVNFDQALYEAQLRAEAERKAIEAEVARLEAERIAKMKEEEARAEADRIAKEQAALEKKEQERIAAEQAKIDAEVAAQKAEQEKWVRMWQEIINFIRNILWKK